MAGLAAYGIFRIISMESKSEFFGPCLSQSDLRVSLDDIDVFEISRPENIKACFYIHGSVAGITNVMAQ
jgi:hypothetical protein